MKPKSIPRTAGIRSRGQLYLIAFFCALATVGESQPEEAANEEKTNALASAFTQFKEQWQASDVETVLIVHVPSESDYRLEYTPARLDMEGEFAMSVRWPKEQNITKELAAKIGQLTARVTGKDVPVRWGFVFLDRKGDRVFSIYLGEKGRKGMVNNIWVDFDSDALFKWAESTFKQVFR